MADFFISRAGADAEVWEWIAQELEELGYTTLYQDRDCKAGESIPEFMARGSMCGKTLALLSPAYLTSPFTRDEMNAAQYARRYLPIRVAECKLPPLFGQYKHIDFLRKTDDARRSLLAINFPRRVGRELKISVAKLPSVSPLLVGREPEWQMLTDAWNDPAIRVVSVVAFGGVGKTSLVVNWRNRTGPPDAERILGWSFYSQGASEDRQASADVFFDHAVRQWFGETNPPKDAFARGEKLADLIRRDRALLILDGLEPLQYPPGEQHGRLRDQGLIALLRDLAADSPASVFVRLASP